MNPKIALVTCIIGDIDELCPYFDQSLPHDAFCFTDQNIMSNHYNIVKIPEKGDHPNIIRAKYFKYAYSQIPELQGYEYIAYIDASIHIKNVNFLSDWIARCKNGIVMFEHPSRDCAMAEAAFSTGVPKYKMLDLDGQCRTYRAAGFPDHYGLWCTGIKLFRRTPELDAMDMEIHEECLRWGQQDQVSQPFIFWKHSFKPDVFPGDMRWNEHTAKRNHKPHYQELGKR